MGQKAWKARAEQQGRYRTYEVDWVLSTKWSGDTGPVPFWSSPQHKGMWITAPLPWLFSSERKSAWISTDTTHALDINCMRLQVQTWQLNVHETNAVKCKQQHVAMFPERFHSFILRKKNSLIKTGISKCMLDAYECMNKLGGDSQVVWCLISVENGGIISAINSHPTPPFPTKHQKCRNVRGDWWRFRNHVLFALFDRSRSVEWRNQSPLCDLVRPGEGKSKGTLP